MSERPYKSYSPSHKPTHDDHLFGDMSDEDLLINELASPESFTPSKRTGPLLLENFKSQTRPDFFDSDEIPVFDRTEEDSEEIDESSKEHDDSSSSEEEIIPEKIDNLNSEESIEENSGESPENHIEEEGLKIRLRKELKTLENIANKLTFRDNF